MKSVAGPGRGRGDNGQMSDYNRTGWIAHFDPDTTDSPFGRIEHVYSWSSEGDALIVNRAYGGLVVARGQRGFEGLQQIGRIVAAVPAAPGWNLKIWGEDGDDETAFVEPIAAWLMNETGELVPMSAGLEQSYLETCEYQRTEIQRPVELNIDLTS